MFGKGKSTAAQEALHREELFRFLQAIAIYQNKPVILKVAEKAFLEQDLTVLVRLKNAVLGDELHDLQKPHNEGRGIASIRGIAADIHQGDFITARIALKRDWEIIKSYPEVVEWLKKHKLIDGGWFF